MSFVRGLGLLVILWISSFALAESPDSPLFKQALQRLEEKDYQGAKPLLIQLVKNDQQRALYWFNLGIAFSGLNAFNEAAKCFDHVMVLGGGLTEPARFYKAKILIHLDRHDEAAALLKDVIESPDTKLNLKNSARTELASLSPDSDSLPELALMQFQQGNNRAALETINRIQGVDSDVILLKSLVMKKLGLKAKRLWAFLDAATGIESNIYEVSSSPTSANVTRAVLGVGGRPYEFDDSSAFILNYQSAWNEFVHAPDLQIFAQQLQGSYEYSSSVWFHQITLAYDYAWWGGRPALTSPGLRLRTRRSDKSFEVGADFDIDKPQNVASQYSYLSGSKTSFLGYVGWTFYPIYFRFFGNYEVDQIGDETFSDESLLPFANKSYGGGAKVLWSVIKDWYLSLQMSYTDRSYSTAALPGNKIRHDQETLTTFKIIRTWSSQFSAYLLFGSDNNASTLGTGDPFNQNFADTTAMIGLTWGFL